MTDRKLQLLWTQGVSDPEATEKLVRNSTSILRRLREIIDKELLSIPDGSVEDYSISNWSCLQADRNGYKRALKNIKKLTDHV